GLRAPDRAAPGDPAAGRRAVRRAREGAPLRPGPARPRQGGRTLGPALRDRPAGARPGPPSREAARAESEGVGAAGECVRRPRAPRRLRPRHSGTQAGCPCGDGRPRDAVGARRARLAAGARAPLEPLLRRGSGDRLHRAGVRGRQPRRPPVAPPDATRHGQRAPADQIRRVARIRRERDSLGVKDVPARALYGAFTQRARETFQLSRRAPHPALIRAYAHVKAAAARANARLGLLPRGWARAIVWAAARVADGTVPDVAVLDPFQAGAGTPTHMNVNEVIAN